MNAKIQRVRKINAAFRLETSLQIIENEIRHFDPAAPYAEISLRGREPAWRGILVVPRNHACKIKIEEFHIPRVHSPATIDGTNQVFAAHAVSRKRKCGGRCSSDTVVERRHCTPESRKVHSVEPALELVEGIRKQPGIKRARHFATKKIGLRFANCDGPARQFRLAVELLEVQRGKHDFRNAQTSARGDSRDGGIALKSIRRGFSGACKPRHEAGPRSRPQPPVEFRRLQMIRENIECPSAISVLAHGGPVPHRAESPCGK